MLVSHTALRSVEMPSRPPPTKSNITTPPTRSAKWNMFTFKQEQLLVIINGRVLFISRESAWFLFFATANNVVSKIISPISKRKPLQAPGVCLYGRGWQFRESPLLENLLWLSHWDEFFKLEKGVLFVMNLYRTAEGGITQHRHIQRNKEAKSIWGSSRLLWPAWKTDSWLVIIWRLDKSFVSMLPTDGGSAPCFPPHALAPLQTVHLSGF